MVSQSKRNMLRPTLCYYETRNLVSCMLWPASLALTTKIFPTLVKSIEGGKPAFNYACCVICAHPSLTQVDPVVAI